MTNKPAPWPPLRRNNLTKGSLFGAALPIFEKRHTKVCRIGIDDLCAVLAHPNAVVFSFTSFGVGTFIVSWAARRRRSDVRAHANINDAITLGI